MSHNAQHQLFHALVHAAGHAYRHHKQHQKHHGQQKSSGGLALIFWGFVLLPVPVIGIPMIIYGIAKCCAD